MVLMNINSQVFKAGHFRYKFSTPGRVKPYSFSFPLCQTSAFHQNRIGNVELADIVNYADSQNILTRRKSMSESVGNQNLRDALRDMGGMHGVLQQLPVSKLQSGRYANYCFVIAFHHSLTDFV